MKESGRLFKIHALMAFCALFFQAAAPAHAQLPASPVLPAPLFYDCAGRGEAVSDENMTGNLLGPAGRGEEAALLVHQALALHDKGEIEEALAVYDRALLIDPSHAAAYFGRAQVFEDLDDAVRAEADYTKGLELNPAEGMGYYRRAVLFEDAGNYEKALADYASAIRLGAAEACSHNNSGIILESMGHRAEALEHYNLAVRKDPSLDKAYLNRGYWHFDSANYGQALADYDKAISLNPGDPLYYQVRAEVYTVLGRGAEAAKDLAAAGSLTA